MEKRISHLVKSFDTPPVSLLIVDDEKTVLSSVAALFSSPLWSITTAATLGGARRALGRPAKPWHCWILDVALGEHENGLELLRIRPDFKFTIVLSGLQSMTISADAMKLGATTVLDKNPDNFDALYNQACLNAALAYLFTTVPDQYFSIFSHLASSVMTDIVQWTEKSCYSERSLERITLQHTALSPRKAMILFYGLYYILWYGHPDYPMKPSPGVPGPRPKDEPYLKSCADTVFRQKLMEKR